VDGQAIVDVLRTRGWVQPMPINGNRAVSIDTNADTNAHELTPTSANVKPAKTLYP
jgi:hypothetical protein